MTRRTAEEWDQWLTEYSRGENTEAWRGIMCFLRWIQIRAENGHPIPNFLPAIEEDIFFSHLLRRLLTCCNTLGEFKAIIIAARQTHSRRQQAFEGRHLFIELG